MRPTRQVIDANYAGNRYSTGVSDVDLLNGNIPGSAIASALGNQNNGLTPEQRALLQYAAQRHSDTMRNGYGGDFDTSHININGLGLNAESMKDALTKTQGELDAERENLQGTQAQINDRLKTLRLPQSKTALLRTPDGREQVEREYGQLGLTPEQAQRLRQLQSYAEQQPQ